MTERASRFAALVLAVTALPACYNPDRSLPLKAQDSEAGETDRGDEDEGSTSSDDAASGAAVAPGGTDTPPMDFGGSSSSGDEEFDDVEPGHGGSTGAFGGSTVCGDAVEESDEACDDGNTYEFDHCTSSCESTTCGWQIDTVLQCADDITSLCLPPSYSAAKAACEACSGALCSYEEVYGGSVWTSNTGFSYVEQAMNCPTELIPIPLATGSIVQLDSCAALLGNIVGP